MALDWFDTKELDAFADAVVQELARRYPPPGEGVTGRKAFERLRQSFKVTFDGIDRFLAGRRLNFYKRAKFANRMRWALADAGYPPAFVDAMTQEVVTHVTLASAAKRRA